MKIITRAVLDWNGNVLEEDSYEYCGPLAQGKSSGSAPQPTDPYAQAAAQYGLDTGTANYNAALNRTNSSNPLGSNTWGVTGTDGRPTSVGGVNVGGAYGFGGGATPGGLPHAGAGAPYSNFYNVSGSGAAPSGGASAPFGLGATGTMGMGPSGPGGLLSTSKGPGTGMNGGSGAPLYSQQTSLTPWANKMLQSPLYTSNIVGVPGGATPYAAPGMPGGPDLTGSLNSTRNAMYNQSMGYLAPQQALAREQSDAQLANQGITPGSAAYGQAKDQLGREQTFANQQAVDSAIGAGNQEQAQLYGLGSQSLQNQLNVGSSSLQNQLALRNAPISEYEALQGNPSSGISAATPDISGAFGQQYQGKLAGYNAGVATDNANTSAAGSALMMAALYAGSAF